MMNDQERTTVIQRVRRRLEYEARQRDSALLAILDAARAEAVPERLQQLQGESVSLYQGQPEESLVEVAPYLVKLEPESELLLWVAEEGWGNSWGIFLVSSASLEDLHQHFQQFLLVRDERAKPFYLRFYDPRVLRVYLPTCTADEIKRFFGPVECLLVESEDGQELLCYSVRDSAVRWDAILLSGLGRQTKVTMLEPAPIPERAWGPVVQVEGEKWVIRDEQMEAFSQYMRKSFEDRVARHLREHFADETQTLPDPGLRSLIQRGIENARKSHIVRERDVVVYVELMVLFGRDFDVSPRTPWAREILEDVRLDARGKVNRLRQRRDAEVERRKAAGSAAEGKK